MWVYECVCVCVCVSVWEREKGRENVCLEISGKNIHQNVNNAYYLGSRFWKVFLFPLSYIYILCEFCFYNEHIWFLQWRRVHSWCFWLSRKALNRGRCHCERTPLFAFLGGKENGRSWVDYKWTWLLFLNFLCLQPRVTLSAQKNLKLKTPSQAPVGVCAPIFHSSDASLPTESRDFQSHLETSGKIYG